MRCTEDSLLCLGHPKKIRMAGEMSLGISSVVFYGVGPLVLGHLWGKKKGKEKERGSLQ